MQTEVVPMEKWNKDHWSTLAYIETCVVDNKGIVSPRRMRTNSRIHSRLAMLQGSVAKFLDSRSPTKIKGGVIEDHDDWSCVEDMMAYGLLINIPHPDNGFCAACDQLEEVCHICFALTDKGRELANRLRQHKADGGTFSTFAYETGDEHGTATGSGNSGGREVSGQEPATSG